MYIYVLAKVAPNGLPSNLSPEDWAYVRSDEFKAWAGDWEAKEYILSGRYVCCLTGNEFQPDGIPLTQKVPKFYHDNGNALISRLDIGEVVLDAEGVRDSIAHGLDRMKSAAFAAVPDVIKQGMVVDKATGYNGKDVESCILMAPVKIADKGFTAIVLLRRGLSAKRHRFYLHEVALQEKLLEESFKTGNKAAPSKENVSAHNGNISKILKKILSSKTILDENGEPKVFYHGTTREFERFDLAHRGDNTGLVEYTDNKTGERFVSDSNKCVFFSDGLHQAASYALLRHYGEIKEALRRVEGVLGCIRGGVLYRASYNTKDDFLRDVDILKDVVPALRDLPERISPLTDEQREPFLAPLRALREKLRAELRPMDSGGLSNQVYNMYLQRKAVDGLRDNLDRLRRNDLDVPNEFGTFETYTQSVFGASGNAEISIGEENGRLIFHDLKKGPEAAVFIDAMTDEEASEMIGRLYRKCDEAEVSIRKRVMESGYNEPSRVYRVFLKADNPFVHDYQGSAFPDVYKPNEKIPTAYVAARQVAAAEKNGCDAVVYEHVRDPFEATTVGVFSPDQILIRERRKGVVEVPEIREKDITHLKNLGVSQGDINEIKRFGGKEVAIKTPSGDPVYVSISAHNDGIVVYGAGGKSSTLGQLAYEIKRDAGFLKHFAEQKQPYQNTRKHTAATSLQTKEHVNGTDIKRRK